METWLWSPGAFTCSWRQHSAPRSGGALVRWGGAAAPPAGAPGRSLTCGAGTPLASRRRLAKNPTRDRAWQARLTRNAGAGRQGPRERPETALLPPQGRLRGGGRTTLRAPSPRGLPEPPLRRSARLSPLAPPRIGETYPGLRPPPGRGLPAHPEAAEAGSQLIGQHPRRRPGRAAAGCAPRLYSHTRSFKKQ